MNVITMLEEQNKARTEAAKRFTHEPDPEADEVLNHAAQPHQLQEANRLDVVDAVR